MLAIIREARKETVPVFDATLNKNVPTLMVIVDVDFVLDDGPVHHSQRYAWRPEEVDMNYFQKQADAMQRDLDHAKARAHADALVAEQNAIADHQISELLNNRFRRSVDDRIVLNDQMEKK